MADFETGAAETAEGTVAAVDAVAAETAGVETVAVVADAAVVVAAAEASAVVVAAVAVGYVVAFASFAAAEAVDVGVEQAGDSHQQEDTVVDWVVDSTNLVADSKNPVTDSVAESTSPTVALVGSVAELATDKTVSADDLMVS